MLKELDLISDIIAQQLITIDYAKEQGDIFLERKYDKLGVLYAIKQVIANQTLDFVLKEIESTKLSVMNHRKQELIFNTKEQ